MFRIQIKPFLVAVLFVGLMPALAVEALEPPPNLELEWGTGGSLPGQFNRPWDVAVDDDGFVYVSDSWNNRIQKFDAAGGFLLEWGQGSDADSLYVPTGLAVHDTHVYVWDAGHHLIKRFTQDGVFVDSWPAMAEAGVSGYLAVDAEGIYAASQDGVVNVFTPAGSFSHSFQVDTNIRDLVISSTGNLFIVEFRGQGRVFEYNPSGSPVGSFTLTTESTTEFISGWGIGTFGPNLYVSASDDFSNILLQKYSETGELLAEWSVGANRGVAVSSDERIYVVIGGADAHVEMYSYQPVVGLAPVSWGTLKWRFADQEKPNR